MTKFLKNCLLFFVVLSMLIMVGLLLPNNSPERSIDYSLIKKHQLLEKTKAAKIILTGGSNVLFGFNSKLIADSLNKPVINHAIHAGYGMKYILDDIIPYVKKNDIVVFSPEYSHFLEKNYLGKEPLLFSLTAVPKNIKKINLSQVLNVLSFIPKFSIDRVKSFMYYILKPDTGKSKKENFYGEFSINEYGDNHTHWSKDKQSFKAYDFNLSTNDYAFEYLYKIQEVIEEKQAKLIVVFPSLCNSSYEINKKTIKHIDTKLKEFDINIIGKPTKFTYEDALHFDTPYHLNGKGVLKRTNQVIEILTHLK